MSEARERLLALFLLGVIFLVGGGFLGYQFLYRPVADRDRQIAALQKEIGEREERARKIAQAMPRLEQYKKLSLPADIDMARREYEIHLNQMLRKSGFDPAGIIITPRKESTANVPTIGRKKPIYTRLEFMVQLQNAELPKLVGFLEDFYHTDLLHQIKNISLQRLVTSSNSREAKNELQVNMTVEALVLDQADKRDTLLPPKDVEGLQVLADAGRQYAAITAKDIFFGPPPPTPTPTRQEERPPEFDVSPFVRLTSITYSDARGPGADAALQLAAGGGAVVLPEYTRAVAELWNFASREDYVIAHTFGGGARVESFYYIADKKRQLYRSSSLTIGSEDSESRKKFRIVRVDPNELILEKLNERGASPNAAALLAGNAAQAALPRRLYRWHVGEVLRDIRPLSAAEARVLLNTPPGVALTRK